MQYDKIWSIQQQKLIQHYITGATEDHNRTYEKLYPTLNKYIDLHSKTFNRQPTEDLQQYIHTRLYTYTLDKITLDKKDTAKDLIFISIKNMTREFYKKQSDVVNPLQSLPCEDYNNNLIQPEEQQYDFINAQEQQDAQTKILTELDRKIEFFSSTKKKSNSLVLMLLLIKDYLITNSFDERECGQYLMQVMKLSRRTIITMMQRTGIRSFLFFRLKLKEDKQLKHKQLKQNK